MSSAEALRTAVSQLPPVALDDVLATAALQTRIDRKYVAPLDVFAAVLDRLEGQLAVLQIGPQRVFRYESVYFDTPDLAAYRQHAHGRRRRVKVRTRAYLDSGECLLEFKSVGARGETVKERYPYPLASRRRLDDEARTLARERVGSVIDTSGLAHVLTTVYHRVTILDRTHGSRMTCDVELEFHNSTGGAWGPLEGVVVLESKTAGTASPVDRVLHDLGARPLSLSKYCVGMAVLDPRLPANHWNRELRTHFGWSPASSHEY